MTVAFETVIMESDYEVVTKAIMENSRIYHPWGRLVERIRKSLGSFQTTLVQFTKRENNKVAHRLVSQAHIGSGIDDFMNMELFGVFLC
jgi:hypothetical protein